MSANLEPSRLLILLLAALTAMTPLAIDAYLPAMPDIAETFDTTTHYVELSLSIFLAAFAIGQLIGGPFSDQFGRRRTTGIGISLYCLGTLIIVFSADIYQLWIGRAIQALGGGLAVVNSSAVIRDLSEGRESARHLANIAIIMMLAPLMAPLIGMLLLHISGWNLIFQFLLAYGLLVGIALFLKLPETRKQSSSRPNIVQRYVMIVTHRQAVGFLFSQWFALSGMFAFITASPSVYMDFFGISKTVYPFLFAANVAGLMLANRINVRLLHYYRPQDLLWLGQGGQLLIALLLFGYISLNSQPSLYIVMPLIVAFIACMGFIVSNATASTVEFFPTNSATATALLGAGGFAAGSLSGALVSIMGDGTPWPMTMVMLLSTLLALIIRWFIQHSAAIKAAE